MKMKNKGIYILLVIVLIAGAAFWYFKHQLKRAKPADAPAITQKETSPIDLRPAAIAKLQQAVKNGSDSLYQLRIDSLLTDVASGTITLKGVCLMPDSNAIRTLKKAQKLPDDVYEISFASLSVSGISLADLMHKRDIGLRSVTCIAPQIIVHHQLQAYNAGKRAEAARSTLFGRMHGQLDRLQIDSISITHATITDHSGGNTNVYRDVSLALRDILIDSAAEGDGTRFLFAKKALLQAGTISMPAGNSGYDLSIGGIAVSGETRTLTIRALSLKPHGGKDEFVRHLKTQTEVFDIAIPTLTVTDINWWAAAHGESLIAKDASLNDARILVYVDKHVPPGPTIKRDNFPQQLLQDLKTPISVKRVSTKNATFIYDEYTKKTDKESSFTIYAIDGVAEGVTNIPAEVAAHPVMRFHADSRFMNVAPMKGDFALELPRRQRGAFKADLTVGGIGHDVVNPFAESMGMVRFSSGQLQHAVAHIEGNNDQVRGTVAAAYTDLRIEPLKAKQDEEGRLKKMPVTKVLANVLFVKNNNPGADGVLRRPDFVLNRTKEGNFFNFSWMALKSGILKTIGVPLSLGM